MSQSQENRPTTLGAAVSDFVTRLGIVGELFHFLWARKLWWLIPMIILLAVFALVIVLGNAAGAAPFIYTLF